jgi:hypothetical protein
MSGAGGGEVRQAAERERRCAELVHTFTRSRHLSRERTGDEQASAGFAFTAKRA